VARSVGQMTEDPHRKTSPRDRELVFVQQHGRQGRR
jgi:hypothetical protein